LTAYTRKILRNNGIIVYEYVAYQGAKGLDGGYEAHVACRGSITTLKDGTNTNANNELALAA